MADRSSIKLFLILAAFSFINILPLLLLDIGGDIDFHLALAKCFAGQFRQGDFYPRWCMDANAGLGSPATLFYFPLPYYVTALLYPLSHIGVSMHGMYVLSLFLAGCATAFACYLWLKDVVSPGRALLVGGLFIFLPYRMEAMLFRSAYAEIWGMALLPLVWKYTRRLALGDKDATLPLAAVFGALCITHAPCAAVAALGGGVYLLVMAGRAWVPGWRYGISLLWAMALAAFYVAPALYYQQFLVKMPLFIPGRRDRGWPNTYLGMDNLHYQTPLALMIALTILALAALALYVLYRRPRISDVFVRREACAWGIVSVTALFLLLPVSEPFYAVFGSLRQVLFPWRMQNLFMAALAFFLSIWMQWLAGERRLKTWKGDFALTLAFLALASYFVASQRNAADGRIAEAAIAAYPEYRTVWTDESHFGNGYFLDRYAHKDTLPAAAIVSGKGDIAVERWAWNGIILKAQSAHGLTVRLQQVYFPVWSAKDDDGKPVTLRLENGTGQILADIPAGERRIVLRYSVYDGQPRLLPAEAASILAALGWMIIFYRRAIHSLF